MSPRRTLLARTLSPIFDLDGKRLGRVEGLEIEIATGKVVAAALTLGGAGGGERRLTVPWEAVVFDQGRDVFLLNLPSATVDDVFDPGRWPGAQDPEGDPPR